MTGRSVSPSLRSEHERTGLEDTPATCRKDLLLLLCDLAPFASVTRGERFCEECDPRPHQVLVTFVPRNGLSSIGFLESDAYTCLGLPYTVKGDEELRVLAKRGHGDLEDLERTLTSWEQPLNKCSVPSSG